MARKKKTKVVKAKDNNLSPELIEIIKVTEEDREKALSKLKYTITPKPEGEDKRGKLWCPYEAKFENFKSVSGHNYKKCKSCGVSEEDYWVKTHNNLWNTKGGK